MIQCDVWIQSTSPLLQNRFPDLEDGGPVDDESLESAVWRKAHFDDDGFLCIPSAAVSLLLRQVAQDRDIRFSRRAVVVLGETIPLFSKDLSMRLEDFETDVRAVKCSHGVRSLCYRPRINAWAAPLRLLVQEKRISPSVIRQLLVEGGKSTGLGDFRPQCGGPFGQFEVVRWNEASDDHHRVTAWEATL
jgi:hypothetical protein